MISDTNCLLGLRESRIKPQLASRPKSKIDKFINIKTGRTNGANDSIMAKEARKRCCILSFKKAHTSRNRFFDRAQVAELFYCGPQNSILPLHKLRSSPYRPSHIPLWILHGATLPILIEDLDDRRWFAVGSWDSAGWEMMEKSVEHGYIRAEESQDIAFGETMWRCTPCSRRERYVHRKAAWQSSLEPQIHLADSTKYQRQSLRPDLWKGQRN